MVKLINQKNNDRIFFLVFQIFHSYLLASFSTVFVVNQFRRGGRFEPDTQSSNKIPYNRYRQRYCFRENSNEGFTARRSGLSLSLRFSQHRPQHHLMFVLALNVISRYISKMSGVTLLHQHSTERFVQLKGSRGRQWLSQWF